MVESAHESAVVVCEVCQQRRWKKEGRKMMSDRNVTCSPCLAGDVQTGRLPSPSLGQQISESGMARRSGGVARVAGLIMSLGIDCQPQALFLIFICDWCPKIQRKNSIVNL